MNANHPLHQTALLLPGGGARAAYQVGVLKGLAELFAERSCNPFPILSGTSAGALNAVALATHADDFGAAREVNEAVEFAHRDGILTAASLMVGAPAAFDAAEAAGAAAVSVGGVMVDYPVVEKARRVLATAREQ